MDQSTFALLKDAVAQGASDIFIIAGLPVSFKVGGAIAEQDGGRVSPATTEEYIRDLYSLAGRDITPLLDLGDDDFSFSLAGVSRFRASAYKQRGSLAAVVRVVTFHLPDPEQLHIPPIVLGLGDCTRGLVLVTGPAGSGKSTTLACLIDRINRSRSSHIITLEDPIEYLHPHKKSIVSQRELSTDTRSYVAALRAALRQSPDVILLGEMRDHETMATAMTAAETGHLVLSSLHTVGAANTIDRIIDAFPPNQQNQMRIQLSMVLQAVVSQQLIPQRDGTMEPAFEIMMVNSAIRNMIREAKTHQMDTVLYSSASEGMTTMDASLLAMYGAGKIHRRDALLYSTNPDAMEKKLNQGRRPKTNP